jgi:hypothetical protein
MNLYGYVVEGQVWGIGDTEAGAVRDAEREFTKLLDYEKRGLVRKSDAPKAASEHTFEVIDLETAKRVANRDLSCPKTPRVWGKVVS